MVLDEKPLDELRADDIQRLVDNEVQESVRLDYKLDMHLETKDQKRELLADLSAFANTSGGFVVFGVEDADGVPRAIPGLDLADPDTEILKIDNLMRDKLEPRVTGHHSAALRWRENRWIIVLYIPRSWLAPHAVTLGGMRFFRRASRSKHPMDVAELRRAFLEAGSTAEQLERLRTDSLDELSRDGSRIVLLQAVPMASLASDILLDPAALDHSAWGLLQNFYSTGGNRIVNFDGLRLEHDRDRAWVQVFRNGVIEIVDKNYFLEPVDDTNSLPAITFEESVFKAASSALSFLERTGVDLPVALSLSLANVKGYSIAYGRGSMLNGRVIDRPTLRFPLLTMTAYHLDEGRRMKGWLDILANAGGLDRAPTFDGQGNWSQFDG